MRYNKASHTLHCLQSFATLNHPASADMTAAMVLDLLCQLNGAASGIPGAMTPRLVEGVIWRAAQMPPHAWHGVLHLHELVHLLCPQLPIGQLVPHVSEAAAALQGIDDLTGHGKPAEGNHTHVMDGNQASVVSTNGDVHVNCNAHMHQLGPPD